MILKLMSERSRKSGNCGKENDVFIIRYFGFGVYRISVDRDLLKIVEILLLDLRKNHWRFRYNIDREVRIEVMRLAGKRLQRK